MSTSPDELSTCLRRYTTFLRERNEALSALYATSEQMRSVLERVTSPDVDSLLTRREQDCARFAATAAAENKSDAFTFESVRALPQCSGGEIGVLVSSAEDLRTNYDDLARKVLICQTECETLLRQRLQAVADALRQSTQRRKLSAAYGPAHKPGTPMFLDRQQ